MSFKLSMRNCFVTKSVDQPTFTILTISLPLLSAKRCRISTEQDNQGVKQDLKSSVFLYYC